MGMATADLEIIQKLSKDIRTASKTLSTQEARYLVDTYYNLQDFRKATGNQIRALSSSNEPNESLQFFFNQFGTLEKSIKSVLDIYVKQSDVGNWCISIMGIGPIITAGLMAHIDIAKAPTVGHIWSYAGLVPGVKWEKGQKRPWNAKLKVLCWKIGQSFVKVHNKENDVFGKVYQARKNIEVSRNEAGENADTAALILATKKYNKDTEAYKSYIQGKLPPAHVQQRAERYAAKMFLASFHEIAYFDRYKILPPKPYAIANLGHAHYWGPPNSHMIAGLVEAQEAYGSREELVKHHIALQ